MTRFGNRSTGDGYVTVRTSLSGISQRWMRTPAEVVRNVAICYDAAECIDALHERYRKPSLSTCSYHIVGAQRMMMLTEVGSA